jgi:hypothetical protein
MIRKLCKSLSFGALAQPLCAHPLDTWLMEGARPQASFGSCGLHSVAMQVAVPMLMPYESAPECLHFP